MGWGKGSDRNFKASQTERYRKTKKDRREGRETSGGDPKIRVRGETMCTTEEPGKDDEEFMEGIERRETNLGFRWENGDSSATVGTSPRLAAASVDVCGSANMY